MESDQKYWFKGMFVIFILLVGLLVSGILKPTIHNKPNTDAVVKVMVQTDDKYYGNKEGSAIFIDDNILLTAGHIVDGASIISIQLQSGEVYIATDWYFEDSNLGDIGLIFVDTNDIEPKATFDDAILGEDVWASGNPFGVFPILTKGIVSAINIPDTFTKNKNMIVVDCSINPGNSGCPLFDKDGNILGICSYITRNAQGMNYFVRSEIIELILEKFKLMAKINEIP